MRHGDVVTTGPIPSAAAPRSTAVALAWAAGIGAAVYLTFLVLAWFSLGVDRAAMTAPVRAAYATGDLRPDATSIFGDTDIGVHQFNDCLILFQAIDDRASRTERAVSPLSPAIDVDGPCPQLRRIADGAALPAPRFYHHYLHAQTTLTRALLPAMGVRGLREVYRLVISLVLLAGIGLALVRMAGGQDRLRNGVWIILFLSFARGYGFESFGQSLGHAPAHLLILGQLLFLSRASANGPIAPRTVLIASAVFGALTMEFEMLTGGLPLGLAVTIGAVPLALARDHDPTRTTILSGVAFVVAALTCAIGKLVALLVVFGTAPITESARQLLFRAGMNASSTRDGTAGWSDFHSHVWAGLQALAPGMQWLTAGLLLIALVAGGWSYARLRRDDDAVVRARALALAGSNVVLVSWMVIFWQHTTQHAWFIDRILVWPLATGFALFALAVGSSERPRHRQIG
jgi:hypothetical protein